MKAVLGLKTFFFFQWTSEQPHCDCLRLRWTVDFQVSKYKNKYGSKKGRRILVIDSHSLMIWLCLVMFDVWKTAALSE